MRGTLGSVSLLRFLGMRGSGPSRKSMINKVITFCRRLVYSPAVGVSPLNP